MISVNNIWKSFDNVAVLKGINLQFEQGKTNLIIGQSGSGKTVLMKCLVGLLEADSGNIFYDSRNFSAMSFRQRKEIRMELGMLFQGGALFDSLTVGENIMFPLRMFTNMTKGEMRARVDFCLDRVNLHNVEHMDPADLSGGMKKRVAIARAISINPKYLFCDEPNSGLDPPTALLIDQLISEITKEFNTTTVVNTHDMKSVMEIGDKVAFIYQGELWWEGSRHNIMKADKKELNDFIEASGLLKSTKN